jgi:hypothetical protein
MGFDSSFHVIERTEFTAGETQDVIQATFEHRRQHTRQAHEERTSEDDQMHRHARRFLAFPDGFFTMLRDPCAGGESQNG